MTAKNLENVLEHAYNLMGLKKAYIKPIIILKLAVEQVLGDEIRQLATSHASETTVTTVSFQGILYLNKRLKILLSKQSLGFVPTVSSERSSMKCLQ